MDHLSIDHFKFSASLSLSRDFAKLMLVLTGTVVIRRDCIVNRLENLLTALTRACEVLLVVHAVLEAGHVAQATQVLAQVDLVLELQSAGDE